MGTQEDVRPGWTPPLDRCPGTASEGHQRIPVADDRHQLNTSLTQTTLLSRPYESQEHQTDPVLQLRAKLLPSAELHSDKTHHQRTGRYGAV